MNVPITVREVLRLLLAADSYPRLGNHDWREAAEVERLHWRIWNGKAKDAQIASARSCMSTRGSAVIET